MHKKRGRLNTLILNSKSQAAIFIIISLIILISGVLYFFYQRQAVEKEVEVVQPEIVPIKLYIENCIKSIAVDGIERIGLSGGFIRIPENIDSNPKAYLSTYPASGFKIPYWWHEGIDAVPSLEFIRQQLEFHLRNEFEGCINKFEPFSEMFEINELEEPAFDVQFNDNDVSVSLKYPLEIASRNGNFKQLAQNFGYTLPIRLKKTYELAKLIMERENNDYFIERKTIDLYSMDTDIPTTDIEATCKTKTWQLRNIKEKLMLLLRVNLPYIRIKGTSFNPNMYVPNPSGKSVYSQTYFQQHYIWDLGEDSTKYKNMKVAFTYDNWPLSIYARPGQNGILRSNAEKGTEMLSFLCLHIWHFTYDINYPVLATVFDEETGENKAYQFNFAFRVAVDHNQPSRSNKGTNLFEVEPDLSSEEYCNDVQNEITIFTADNATGDDIRGVNLTFVCGRFYCDIGQSNWLSLGAAAGLTKRLPYCVNGIIKGAKDGFLESKSFIQTDKDNSYVLMLNPIKEFRNYKVVMHSLSNPNTERELKPNEKASILIKGKDIGYESFAVYPKDGDFPLKLLGKDATYEVTIYIVDDESIVGGYVGELKASKDELESAQEIIFHAIEQQGASDDEKYLFVSGLGSYSKGVMAPELK